MILQLFPLGIEGHASLRAVPSERWNVDSGRGGRGKLFPDNPRRAGDREDRWGSLRDDGNAPRKWISPTDHGRQFVFSVDL